MKRIACVLIASGIAAPSQVGAQPKPDEEIELEPDTVGPGSATPAPDPVPAPTKDPKAAKKWHQAGLQLVAKGDYLTRKGRADDAKTQYDNALVALQKSIEAGDDINVFYDLASVEEKLGKLPEATKHYKVVVEAQAGVRPDVRKKATARYDDITTKIGMVTLIVKPEGATVVMAGNEIGKAPLPETLVLMPGTYTFSFIAEGHQPREIELSVEGGSESERTIELEPVKIIVEEPKQDIEQPLPPPPPAATPDRLPLYIGGGVAAAGLGVTVITGVLALGKHDTFTSPDASEAERADAKSSGERLALISDLSLVTTIVAGGFTAYWYFARYRPALAQPAGETSEPTAARRRRPMPAKVTAVPWVKTDGAGGVSIAGWF